MWSKSIRESSCSCSLPRTALEQVAAKSRVLIEPLIIYWAGKSRAVAQMVESRIFPYSPRRGGCAIKKIPRSILLRADGVVFNLNKIWRNLSTTPSAPKRRLRDILLRSRPPLPCRKCQAVPHSTSPD
jgi:hypothetical protein